MWGQVLFLSRVRDNERIIPTRVGTRKGVGSMLQLSADHPHACGDKQVCALQSKNLAGSSPRVWGQGAVTPCRFLIRRIIPTRVGTRAEKARLKPLALDHPHACGDKQPENNGYVPDEGSSPRVWGQVALVLHNVS